MVVQDLAGCFPWPLVQIHSCWHFLKVQPLVLQFIQMAGVLVALLCMASVFCTLGAGKAKRQFDLKTGILYTMILDIMPIKL